MNRKISPDVHYKATFQHWQDHGSYEKGLLFNAQDFRINFKIPEGYKLDGPPIIKPIPSEYNNWFSYHQKLMPI